MFLMAGIRLSRSIGSTGMTGVEDSPILDSGLARVRFWWRVASGTMRTHAGAVGVVLIADVPCLHRWIETVTSL